MYLGHVCKKVSLIIHDQLHANNPTHLPLLWRKRHTNDSCSFERFSFCGRDKHSLLNLSPLSCPEPSLAFPLYSFHFDPPSHSTASGQQQGCIIVNTHLRPKYALKIGGFDSMVVPTDLFLKYVANNSKNIFFFKSEKNLKN